ncbi:MAG: right-handed parallel beta-helix repeat-containing protein [Acidimicrobiia bacterium]|nr:right-handed parallel beta-helix repeat-containing protein [Acidimicrobiia bacterium]
MEQPPQRIARRAALAGLAGAGLVGASWAGAGVGAARPFGTAPVGAQERSDPTDPADPGGPMSVSVRSFGAVGDGRTDDAPAFREAIAAVQDAGGGVVVVPAGVHNLAPEGDRPWALRIPSHVSLRGVGATASVLRLAPDVGNTVRLLSTQGLDSAHFSVSHLTLDGNRVLNRNAPVVEQRHGVFLWGVTDVVVEHCVIRRFTGDAVYVGTASTDVVVRHCELRDTDRNGVTLAGDGEIRHVTIAHNRFEGVAVQDIDSEPNDGALQVADVVVVGNVIDSNPTSRYAITTAGADRDVRNHGWRIVANEIRNGGVSLLWVDDATVSGNHIDLTGSTRSDSVGVEVRHHCNHLVVANNTIRGGVHGIRAVSSRGSQPPRHLTIDANQVVGAITPFEAWGVRSAQVVGNLFDATEAEPRSGTGGDGRADVDDDDRAAVVIRTTRPVDWVNFNANTVVADRGVGVRLWLSHGPVGEAMLTDNVVVADGPLDAGFEVRGVDEYLEDSGTVCIATNVVGGRAEVAVAVPDGFVYLAGGTSGSGDARLCGTGSPQGRVRGAIGATYQRLDGGSGSTSYVKEGDAGGVDGWRAVATSSP